MADSNLQNELNTLKEDIAKLRVDVADLGPALKAVAADKARNAKSRLAAGADALSASMRERLDEARQKGREVMDGLEEQISGHPKGSIITALGVGYIIASFFYLGGFLCCFFLVFFLLCFLFFLFLWVCCFF